MTFYSFDGKPEDLQNHIDRLNNEMNFNADDESCYLTKDNISLKKNTSLVFFYKLVANSILGKCAQ